MWKLSIVTPIFKGGDRSLVANYRPISKQSLLPKLFETVVTNKLALLFKNVIINEQHGFVTGRSTSTNLLISHDFIASALEDGSQIDAVYTDFKKAFDTVDHTILMAKLHRLGIHGSLLKWLSSFITGRSQTVKYGDCYSKKSRPRRRSLKSLTLARCYLICS